ncbi:CU044_2847 family protein [Pseudanabaena sp. FACHB-2040]|uniref:CU044_2847 family protein n=1 Tax=Pseudanabaena sp. FACHB-2040 TaxID=2692859 RepID=UPI0016895DEA|nr:CU044_2847 family protein [Pseudanabaena sp. FACHB-2040]MBD2256181.1 hypothetical protein [Pseudanabaena sp. FACHB-2040]
MSDIIHTSGSTEESILLFEISGAQGVMRAGGLNTMELATKSAQALSQAMGAIQTLANRTTETINQLPQKPSEFELEFGIKIDAEAGAIVSKSGSEGNLRVKLVWRNGAQQPT